MTDEKELSGVSDKWLDALIEQKELELKKLTAEHDRRHRPDPKNLHTVDVGPLPEQGVTDAPYVLARLEYAIHRFGDVHGFDADVEFHTGFVRFIERGRDESERT